MYVAEHTAIWSIDHLIDGVNVIFKDSKVAGLKCKRTKCTAVIRKVLAPHFCNLLVAAIGDIPFSIIIDETTDVKFKKVLGIVVQFIDLALEQVSSTFLGFIEIPDETAAVIAETIDKFIQNTIELDVNQCVGVGTDNASAMVGSE